MDFATSYVLEEDEEEIEPEPFRSGGVMEFTMRDDDEAYDPARYGYTGGMECEIMDFEDDEDDSNDATSTTQCHGDPLASKAPNLNRMVLKLKKLRESFEKKALMSQKIECQNQSCGAIFSNLDKPLTSPNGDKTWNCKFCGMFNPLTAFPDFEAKDNDVIYVENLDKIPDLEDAAELSKNQGVNIIFLIDTSSSMELGVKLIPPLEPSPLLRKMVEEATEERQRELARFCSQKVESPFMDDGKLKEITRLQAVKTALIDQLESMKKTMPQARVGLIEFNDYVLAIGDGTGNFPPIDINNKYYADFLAYGQTMRNLKPIAETADILIESVKQLRADGRTALGPALCVGHGMAQSIKGSKIILCTDGLANQGIGKLDDSNEKPISEKFYRDIIKQGQLWGASTSIFSFDDCGLNTPLGGVPQETGGKVVKKANPMDIKKQLTEELDKVTLGTEGHVKFVVSQAMYIKDPDSTYAQSCKLEKDLGNILMDRVHSFEFAFKPKGNNAMKEETKRRLPPTTNDPALSSTSGVIFHPGALPMVGSISTAGFKPPVSSQNPDPSGLPNKGSDQDPNQEKPGRRITSAGTGTTFGSSSVDPPLDSNPFQLQFFYKDLAGTSALRVWTLEKETTKDREKAEKTLNLKRLIEAFLQSSITHLLSLQRVPDPSVNKEALKKDAQKYSKEIQDHLITPEVQGDDELRYFLEKYQIVAHKIAAFGFIDDSMTYKLQCIMAGTRDD